MPLSTDFVLALRGGRQVPRRGQDCLTALLPRGLTVIVMFVLPVLGIPSVARVFIVASVSV